MSSAARTGIAGHQPHHTQRPDGGGTDPAAGRVASADPAACRAERISVAYRGRAVLEGASLEVAAGTAMAIVGPNGAGKSTLLKAMLGLTPTLTGRTLFFGRPLAQVRRRVSYMPQSASVDWDFPATVNDVVMMGTYAALPWWRRPGAAERADVTRALAEVEMSEFADRQFGRLSGGQRQRVFLARALVSHPDLLLLDEPFQGIDARSQAAIVEVFAQLRQTGKTIVFIHHDLATVHDLCDHVTLVNRGVVASGAVDTTFTRTAVARAYNVDPDSAGFFAGRGAPA